MVDTPGFDDPTRSNHKILAEISQWTQGVVGVLYLHRVTDIRVKGESRFNLDIIKALCGPAFYHRVVICTTMWDVTAPATMAANRARVQQLLADGDTFGRLMDGGARHVEFWADKPDEGRAILGMFEDVPPPLLAIEWESRGRESNLTNTNASSVIYEEEEKREKAKNPVRQGITRSKIFGRYHKN